MGIDGIGAIFHEAFADVEAVPQRMHQRVRPLIKVVIDARHMRHRRRKEYAAPGICRFCLPLLLFSSPLAAFPQLGLTRQRARLLLPPPSHIAALTGQRVPLPRHSQPLTRQRIDEFAAGLAQLQTACRHQFLAGGDDTAVAEARRIAQLILLDNPAGRISRATFQARLA